MKMDKAIELPPKQMKNSLSAVLNIIMKIKTDWAALRNRVMTIMMKWMMKIIMKITMR